MRVNREGGLLEGGLNRGFTVFKTGNGEWRVGNGEEGTENGKDTRNRKMKKWEQGLTQTWPSSICNYITHSLVENFLQ